MKKIAGATAVLVGVSLSSIFSAGMVYGADTRFCDPEMKADPCASSTDPTSTCRAVLEQDPYRLSARISLCDAYATQGEFVEASVLIAEGLDICGSRSYACNRLEVARSNISEGGMPTDRRREWEARMEARRNFCLSSVSFYDTAIKSCKEALVARPEDPQLHKALAAKYRSRDMTAAALISYGNAIAHGADGLEVIMAEVELERGAQADGCLYGGELPSCDSAVLPGAGDEFELQQQRGDLLTAASEPEAALEALAIAQALNPGDKEVAAKLLGLFDALGPDVRDEPARLTARAYALLATGRELDAMVVHNMTPVIFEDERIEAAGRELFEAAEERRRRTVSERCLSRDDERAVVDCNRLIVAGLPDRRQIQDHVAQVEAMAAARAAARPPAVVKAPAVPPVVDDPSVQDTEERGGAARATTFSNVLNEDEVTY